MRAGNFGASSGVVVRALMLLLLCCGLCRAQGGDDVRRLSSNVDGADYPRVHLDAFAYLAGFSGAPTDFLFSGNTLDPKTFHNGVLADSAAFNKKVRLLWLGVGEVEDQFMLNGVKAFHDALDHAAIHHVFYVSPGTAHEWQTWRRDLSELAPQLFVGVTP